MERKLERVRLSDIDLDDATYCARLEFNDEEIQSLADSIDKLGLRNPPGYVRKSRKLIVNFGWRRTLAIKSLGWEEFDAWVYEGVSDRDLHLQNLSDDQDRDDLSVLELAGKVRTLRGLDIPVEEIAKRLDKGSQHVYDLLKLTEMPQEIQLATHRGEITLYQAREIFKFPVSKRLEILHRTLDEKLSVGALKRMRRGDFAPSVSEETEETLRRIVAESAEKGVEITYDELLGQIRPQDEVADRSVTSRRLWKSHRGWVVDIPYDWKERQEDRLGVKIRKVNVEAQSIETLNASILAHVLLKFMEKQKDGFWQGEPTELYIYLQGQAEELGISTRQKAWPKASHVMTRRLNELSPSLPAAGYQLDTEHTGKKRRITIYKLDKRPENAGNGDKAGLETENAVSGVNGVSGINASNAVNATLKDFTRDISAPDSPATKLVDLATRLLDRNNGSMGIMLFFDTLYEAHYHRSDVEAVLRGYPQFVFTNDTVSLRESEMVT